MRRILCLFILSIAAVFVLVGCGGGGGGGGGGGTPGVLAGQYTLTGITIISSDGRVVTEQDAVPWSGHLDMGNTTMAIQLTMLGNMTQMGGPYSVIWSSGTAGTISDGYDTIGFTLSGGMLTWHFSNLDMGNGITADMWLDWQKVSDTHTSLSPDRESTGTNDVYISEIKSQLRKGF